MTSHVRGSRLNIPFAREDAQAESNFGIAFACRRRAYGGLVVAHPHMCVQGNKRFCGIGRKVRFKRKVRR